MLETMCVIHSEIKKKKKIKFQTLDKTQNTKVPHSIVHIVFNFSFDATSCCPYHQTLSPNVA